MVVEPDPLVAKQSTFAFISSQIRMISPKAASVSVEDVDMMEKLKRDNIRLTRDFEPAVAHFRELINFARNVKPNPEKYPEMEVGYLVKVLARLVDAKSDAQAILNTQLAAFERVELEISHNEEEPLQGLLTSAEAMFEDGGQFELVGTGHR